MHDAVHIPLSTGYQACSAHLRHGGLRVSVFLRLVSHRVSDVEHEMDLLTLKSITFSVVDDGEVQQKDT